MLSRSPADTRPRHEQMLPLEQGSVIELIRRSTAGCLAAHGEAR